LILLLNSARTARWAQRDEQDEIDEGLDDYYEDVDSLDDGVEYEEELEDLPDESPDAPPAEQPTPEFLEEFTSSNLKSVAYDPESQQLWIRFLDNSVYTYYDIPIRIWKGFWSAPSKGHYFWEAIRRNPSIEYHKLASSLHWLPVNYRTNVIQRSSVSLNSAIAEPDPDMKPLMVELLEYLQKSVPEQHWSADYSSSTLHSNVADVRFEVSRRGVIIYVKEGSSESSMLSKKATLVSDAFGFILSVTLQ